MDDEKVKALISDLKAYYRSYELTGQSNTHIANLLKDSANMLDELRSMIVREETGNG